MKSYRKELWFNTRQRVEFLNITDEVDQALKESESGKDFAWSMPCTLQPVFSLTIMSPDYGTIIKIGLKNWRLTAQFPSTTITGPAKIMEMLI